VKTKKQTKFQMALDQCSRSWSRTRVESDFSHLTQWKPYSTGAGCVFI